MQEVWVLSLLGKSPEGNGNHSSIFAWEIPWTEGPGRLYSPWGYKRAGHGLATKQQQQMQILFSMIVLVSSGCRNRILHIFISHSSREEGSPESGCWLIWSRVRACFLNHRWQREREGVGRGALLVSSYKVTNLIIKALLPWPNDFPKAPFPNTMEDWGSFSLWIFGGHIQSTTTTNIENHSIRGVCVFFHIRTVCPVYSYSMLLNTLNAIEMNWFSVDHMPWSPHYIWVSAYCPGGVINNTSFYCQICPSLGNKLYDQHLYYQYFKDIFALWKAL